MEKIEKFFDYLSFEKSYSKNTVISYRNDITDFLKFLQNIIKLKINKENLENLEHKDFRSWLSYRKNIEFSDRSNARALSAVKSLFKFLQKRQNIFNPVISKIKTPKTEKSLPRTVSVNNFFKMSECISIFAKDDWCIKRDLALITLIYGSGLRISEALNINNNSFISKDQIKVLGKGNKERIVPILPIVQNYIEEYKNICPYKTKFDEYIFISKTGKKYSPRLFQKLIENIRRLLNMPENITPHAFRHSFATDLLNAGVDMRSIQELLGHKTISSTQVYAHLNYDHLMEVYKKSSIIK